MPEKQPPIIDDDILRELTGQTDVRDPDHARSLLGIAQQEAAAARVEHDRTRWPLRKAWFRMLPVTLRMPPLVAALVLSSAIIFALAMLLIVVHLAEAVVLIAVVSVGYTLGFGVILYLLNDRPDENDQNRAAMRRRELQAAVDARDAAAAKVVRLERETVARQQLLNGVITAKYQSMRKHKPPAGTQTTTTTTTAKPAEPEYGGG